MIEPTEISLAPMVLVGLTAQTTQAELNATSAHLWQRAGELDLDKHIRNAKEPNVTLECQFNWHPTDPWTFMLAMEVTRAEAVPSEATVHTVPAAKWLAFDLPGAIPNIDVVSGWDEIIEWFRANGRPVPFSAYIQRYDERTGRAQNLIQIGGGI